MSFRETVGKLSFAFLSLVRTRIELFSLEAVEQKHHLIKLLVMMLAAMLFAALALLVFSLGVVVYVWPGEYRTTAIICLALLYALIAAGLFWLIRSELKRSEPPFSATLDELQADLELLSSKNHADPLKQSVQERNSDDT